ncbi:hypothetical protein BO70DRAFT_195455 [Aspergillus heteromorphus CBS 117.55]|uniref:Uncharacterized protein n=1 Tax=Aspergillus heteromorphus CBS 117.55 TaxID=1448321 RepID=A0A317WLW3_9EURO|nr:uncharacterized protein BO70DRAFT_195455 [Aspergillus heteromorphus CBS 117.55]PWY87486.1 hypothetical protein BO70DRAFT_195455 [Aspergillus heteromorphus CBS 117.55]
MEQSPRLRRHRSSLEGVIIPVSRTWDPKVRDLAIQISDEIIATLEPSQSTNNGYKPVTLIRLMRNAVSEKDDFLRLLFSFIQQDLLGESRGGGTGLDDQILPYLASFPDWPADEIDTLSASLAGFSQYLVENFFLPLKALAVKTPQSTPDLSHSRTPSTAIGTPQRVSNLRRACLVRDRHRCVITRKFDAQEAQTRYKRDGRNVKDDDGKSLLPERDTMAYLEVAHIIPHSLMSLTSEDGEWRLIQSK